MNRVILGNGLLGNLITLNSRWQFDDRKSWDSINRKNNDFDFTKPETYLHKLDDYDEIINCVAYTNTYDPDREKHWEVNVKGTSYLVDYCKEKNKKLIHISTDYVYSNSSSNASEDSVPVHCENWYGYTKLISDAYVQLKLDNYLLIRCSHKPYPFPYKKAFAVQLGNFDYVDTISNLIIKLIIENCEGIYNVGTEVKTMYELAKRTNFNVLPEYELPFKSMPNNITMNLNKLNKII